MCELIQIPYRSSFIQTYSFLLFVQFFSEPTSAAPSLAKPPERIDLTEPGLVLERAEAASTADWWADGFWLAFDIGGLLLALDIGGLALAFEAAGFVAWMSDPLSFNEFA